MKKHISVSNLTLDLYLDYVRPAAIAAGIIELTATEDGKQIYVTDTATADEIAHCMYCACMCAGNDGIERTHEEYVRHEAERMIGQLEVSIKYDLHGYGETLTALLDAMTAALQPAEAPQEAPITITLTRLDLCNLALACTNARQHAGDTPNASKWTLLHDTIMAEIIAADEAAQEAAPTTETEQPTTEEEEETPATTGDMLKARSIIISKGGYRERHLLTNPHTATRSTWTTEHKVVEILSTTPDPDGYRAGCAVDIVTRSIVG